MQQNDHSENTYRMDPLTCQLDLELREPEWSTHHNLATDGEYRIKMDMCNDLVHVVKTHQFAGQHSCENTPNE
jgi:hypothetical protein